MFNALKLLQDHRIQHADSGSKHTRPGWVNVHCPFCKGYDYHLGIHISSGAVNCWKCGPHSQLELIKALLSCDWNSAKEIQEEYTQKGKGTTRGTKEHITLSTKTVCEYPSGTEAMKTLHRAYLEGRNFDPEHLEKIWGLKGTGHLGDYKFRVIAPIVLGGRMVSFQGRDVTGKSSLRYKACEQINEVLPHQNVVYGLDLVKGDSCIVVEGIADVWRLGPGAVSCFGTSFTIAQVNLLKNIRRIFVLFDSDEENAIKMSNRLAHMLSSLGVTVEVLELDEGDPAEMPQSEATALMRELFLL